MSNIGCILYPPTLDYYYLVQRPQQIMNSVAKLGINAFYLNNPSPQSNVVTGIDNVMPNLYLFNNVNPMPYLKNIRPVVYYTSAAQVDLIKQYNPSLVVFDSVDEPSDEFEAWLPYYDKATRTADIVLTTSDKLFERACAHNPNTYLIPNGCDFEHFSRTDLPIPDDIANIPRPIIGYIGVVATWVDLELIAKMADNFPQYNIVIVGPLYNVTDVPRRANIHWLSYKPYDQLPAYTQMFDVGIIPFERTNMVQAVNPIKMWEYMASGMPIVTTSIPEAGKYSGLVLTSETHAEFMANIEYALKYDSLENRSQRLVLAQQNSWLVRTQQIIQIIEEKLAQKGMGQEQELEPINTTAVHHATSSFPVSYQDGFQVFDTSVPSINPLGPYRTLKVGRRVAVKFYTSWGTPITRGSKTRVKLGSPHRRLNIVGKASFKYKTERAR